MIEINDNNIFLTEDDEINNIIHEDIQVLSITEHMNNIKLSNNSNVFISINIDDIWSIKNLIKNIKKIYKQCKIKKITLGIEKNEKNIIGQIIGPDDNKLKRDVIDCITVMFLDNKKLKIQYIYDHVCNYLDEEFIKNNYCDFKNDVCVSKRSGTCPNKVTMGCCHRFIHPLTMSGKLVLCKYFDINKKQCKTKCMTCKFFTCDTIRKKFRMSEFPLLNYFFNPIQKFIIKISYFTSKEKILSRLYRFKFINN